MHSRSIPDAISPQQPCQRTLVITTTLLSGSRLQPWAWWKGLQAQKRDDTVSYFFHGFRSQLANIQTAMGSSTNLLATNAPSVQTRHTNTHVLITCNDTSESTTSTKIVTILCCVKCWLRGQRVRIGEGGGVFDRQREDEAGLEERAGGDSISCTLFLGSECTSYRGPKNRGRFRRVCL
jgi:hypothetical protein